MYIINIPFILYAFTELGSLQGTIHYREELPPQKSIQMLTDPIYCGGFQVRDESLVVDSNSQGLANVVVWVKGSRAQSKPNAHVLLNKGCRFQPHVNIAYLGQTLQVINHDQTFHSSSAIVRPPGHHKAKAAFAFNVNSEAQAMPQTVTLNTPGVYDVTCIAHSWMQAWIYVLKEEIATVSNSRGEFSLSNVPDGKHQLSFWHEKLGTRTETVRIKHNETTQLTFEWH